MKVGLLREPSKKFDYYIFVLYIKSYNDYIIEPTRCGDSKKKSKHKQKASAKPKDKLIKRLRDDRSIRPKTFKPQVMKVS